MRTLAVPLQKRRTVPYRTRTVPTTNVAYPYHYKKGVPYQRTVAYFFAKIEAYQTVLTYRTDILARLRLKFLKYLRLHLKFLKLLKYSKFNNKL